MMKQLVQKIQNKLSSNLTLRVIGWAVSAFFVFFAWFLAEMYNFRSVNMLIRYCKLHPYSMLMGWGLTAILYLVFLLAFRKSWIAATVLGSIYQIAVIVNYIKVDLNGDPFVPMDFTMTGKMGELLSFVRVHLPLWGYLLPLMLIAYIVLIWLWRREMPRGVRHIWYRAVGSVLLVLVLVGFLHPKYAEKNFAKFGMSYMDTSLQSSNYRANGFLGGFYLNIATMSVAAPENYSEQAVTELLDGFTATEGETDPDIIVFMSESYWDVRKLSGTTFSADPLYFYDELCKRDNAYSGTFYTTALGGGTVRPEFEVLTGLTTEYLPSGASPYLYAKSAVPSCVAAYQQKGYKTLALHPYDKAFYTRNLAYPYIGFDEFYGYEELRDQIGKENVTFERGYFSDDSFADAIIAQLEENKEDPTFLFALSMENHQAFKPLKDEEYEITAQSTVLEGELLKTVNTYAQGVYHASKALEKLVNYIDSREKETILIFFGDHLPTLGNNYAAYEKSGLFSSATNDAEGRKVMYGTPYVIYGNYPLKSDVLPKENGEISSYYLLSAAAEMADADRTAYMNWLLEKRKGLPYYNLRLSIPKTEEITSFCNAHRLFTYDRLVGKRYSK